MERGCEWEAGCNKGAFRSVSLPDGRERWLCLRHCGRVWNARKVANRAAGLCPCGAAPTPGFKTCRGCRGRARADRRRARAFAARAAECGIRLPRQAGRRRAFMRAYAEAFHRSQRQARQAWRREWHRDVVRCLRMRLFTATVAVPWESHSVTCRAVFDVGRGGMRVRGIPADVAMA